MPKTIIAEQFSRQRKPGQADGTVHFVLEYLAAEGPPRSGKAEIAVKKICNCKQLRKDLKSGLVTHLNTKYSPEVFRERDIVLG